jgi:predicted Ser/Thr protein kinase
LEKVAQGGMGVVWKAYDPVLGRTVALKMIRNGVLADNDEVVRFLREAQAAGQLRHPNIVPVYEVGEEAGQYYFTMPLVTGGSLREHLKRLWASPRAVVRLVEKVARAVQAAHDQGILHRDLKPGNVLLEQEEPLVADFGLAKFLDQQSDLTRTGQSPGTPAYMAPEQVGGRPGVITAKADVWALGVVLYEALTGQRPFQAGEREKLCENIRNTDPPRPRAWRADLDRDLETIVLKCLDKDPARRYTAAGLAEDLARWQRGEPLLARPEPRARRLWRALRRHPVRTTVAAVALVVVLGGALLAGLVDPARPARALRSELAENNSVSLLDARGLPRTPRWAVGTGQMTAAADGTCHVETWTLSLLELTPDPQHQRYLYRAQVRHEKSDENGEVGIYFNHGRHAAVNGDLHCFCQLSFNDIQDVVRIFGPRARERGFPPPEGNQANLVPRLYVPTGAGFWGPRLSGLASPPFRAAGVEGGGWHTLEVRVTPDSVQGTWDGRDMGLLSGNDRRKSLAELITTSKGHPELAVLRDGTVFPARGGLGLYLMNGSASFQDVVIVPSGDGD